MTKTIMTRARKRLKKHMSIFECKHFKMQYFTKINMFYTILKSLKKNIKAYFLQNRFDMEYLTIIENKKA